MAKREIKTTIALDGESKFRKAISEAQRELKVLGQELKLNTAEFGKNDTSMKGNSERAAILKKSIEQQKEVVRALSQAVKESATAYGESDKRTDDYRERLVKAQTAVANMERELKSVNDELKNHTKAFEDAGKKIKDAGSKIEDAGKKLSVVSGAVAAAGVASVKSAADFESGINKINTLDLSASEEKINGIKDDIMSLSNETGVAAGEIAESTYQMGSALGELKDNTVEYVGVATKAAVGGFTDTSTAVNGLSTVMNAYGLTTAEQMGKVSDMMLTAQNLGKTTFGEIASSVGNVVPIFKQAGGSTEELFAAYAILTKNGIQTAQATTGLKAALSNIIKPSESAAMAASALGLDFSASAIESKGFAGFLEDLRASIKNVAPAYEEILQHYDKEEQELKRLEDIKAKSKKTNKELNDQITAQKNTVDMWGKQLDALASATDGPLAAYASLFGSVEALNSLLVLASDSGIEQYREAVAAMGESAGATNKAYEQMQEGFNGSTQKIMTKIQNFGIEVGEKLLPKLEPLLDWLQKGTDKLSQLDDKTLSTIVTVGSVIAVLGPLTVGLGNAVSTVGTLVGAVPKLSSAVSALFTAMSAHPVIAAVSVALGAVGAACAAVSAHFNKYAKEIKAVTDEITPFNQGLASMTPQLLDVNNSLSNTGKTLSELSQGISEHENAITEILAGALEEQRALRQSELDDIRQHNEEMARLQEEQLQMYRDVQISTLRKVELESSNITKEGAQQRLVDAKEGLAQANQATEEAYTQRLTLIENQHKAAGTLDSDAYRAEMQAAKEFYDQSIAENESYYKQTLSAIGKYSQNWLKADADKWNELNSGQKMSAKTYTETLKSMDLEAANAFLSMVASVKENGGEISTETANVAKSMLGAFDNLPSGLRKAGDEALRGMVQGLESQIPALENAGDMSAKEIVEAITSYLQISSPSRLLREKGAYAMQGLAGGIQDNTSLATSKATSAARSVANAFDSLRTLGTQARTWGRDFLTQFINGFTEKVSSLVSGVKNIAKTIADYLHFSRPDKGPLRDYESWMPDMLSGMAAGLRASAPRLDREAARIAQNLSSRLNNAGAAVDAGLIAAQSAVSDSPVYMRDRQRETAQDDSSGGKQSLIVLQMDGREVGRVLVPHIEREQGRLWRRDLSVQPV